MSVSMKSSVAAVAAVIGAFTLMPAAASAQSYGYGNSYQNQGYSQPYGYNQGYGNNGYRDRCQTLGQGRTGAGALIGAGVGAVAGSQIAARGNRTEGSIIGGVLGAIVGSQVGRASNSNCQSNGYQGSAYAPPATYYNDRDRYDDRAQSYGRYDDRRYDSRSNDRRYDNGYQVSADGYYVYDPRRGWVPR
ncbi:conserved hypothetical protein [Brevundimonas subvibrioides ATCC 15264]|uniref:17 kDa surface antigen n=2 Tax=Brevundimonas subvibrioides TaxID=74313 RepID=D9QHH0_BRESC|nr:conserved hypothetical protein [Brevundimonas subvibrioides ATCC 15264]